jgi:hypothetical protein
MQLQGLLIMLFFTIVIPIIIMSYNHNVFFILVAVILLIASLKDARNIISFLKSGNNTSDTEDSEDLSDENDMIEELEEMTNVNVKKFNIGIGFVKSLILLLFFVYCAIYCSNIYFRILISALLLYWLHQTINLVSDKFHVSLPPIPLKLQLVISLFVDLTTVVIIIIAAYNKYIAL